MATESQLTISPPNFSARVRDSAVFPLAVGPRITTSNGSEATFTGDADPTFSASSSQSHARSEPPSAPAEEMQLPAVRLLLRHQPRGGAAWVWNRSGDGRARSIL